MRESHPDHYLGVLGGISVTGFMHFLGPVVIGTLRATVKCSPAIREIRNRLAVGLPL